MPDLPGSKGVPASRLSHLPSGNPHAAAIASKRPPSASVADVSTTVLSENSELRSVSATDRGATDTPRVCSLLSTHTTSSESAGSPVSNTSRMRVTVSPISASKFDRL